MEENDVTREKPLQPLSITLRFGLESSPPKLLRIHTAGMHILNRDEIDMFPLMSHSRNQWSRIHCTLKIDNY